MDYNEELYNVSKDAIRKNKGNPFNTPTKEESEKINKAKTRLLRILTKRFHDEAKKHGVIPSMLNIRIKKTIYTNNKAQPGYNDIYFLLEKGEFASFSEDYLIYLAGSSYEKGNSYFDIVWDYKKYYLMSLPIYYEKQITDTAYKLADDIERLILK